MSNLNKIDVPVPVQHKTKLDLSCSHATTSGFMHLQPVIYRHCIKGEHLNLNVESIVRPMPIEVPVFGTIKQNLRAFFVPYRLVFPNWDAFYNDVIASNYGNSSIVGNVPIIDSGALVDLFTVSSYGLSTVVTSDPDFEEGAILYRYTPLGRRYLKILESLGYRVDFSSKQHNLVYNALALLCFARVYIDWYANSQYLNTFDVLQLEQMFRFNDPTGQLILSDAELWTLLGLCDYVVYDNEDYYTNAWDNPVSPVSGQFTSFSFTDPTSTGGAYIQTNVNGSPEMVINSSYPLSVGTTYIHEALKRLTDFQKRHALAGARSIDRVLAQYGVITDSLRQNRSIYIGSSSVMVDIGSIYATADSTNGTTSSSTGDFTGAGFGKGQGTFDFVPQEEGLFVVVSSIVPTGDLYQGYDRNNVHLDKYDFFVPEFDSLGVQALEKGEVFVSDFGTSFINDSSAYMGVFGFTGRYGEYKRPKSFVTGDLRPLSSIAGTNSWYLNRSFGNGTFGDISGLVHSLDFTRGLDASQYNRIFQYTLGDFEPFYLFMRFNFVSHAPCKPLFETYEFEESGKQVPTENGSKLN